MPIEEGLELDNPEGPFQPESFCDSVKSKNKQNPFLINYLVGHTLIFSLSDEAQILFPFKASSTQWGNGKDASWNYM